MARPFELRERGIKQGANAAVYVFSKQVARHPDAQPLRRSGCVLVEIFRNARRVKRVVPAYRVEENLRVLDRLRQGADLVERGAERD